MNGETLSDVMIFYVVGLATPGPTVVMSLNLGRRIGFRRALPFILGMISGFALIMFLCAVFNIYLERFLPRAKPFVAALGVTYILWLAVKQFKPKAFGASEIPGESRPFLTGALLQFVNPKVFFLGLTIMSRFVLPYYDSFAAAAAFSAALGLINLCSLSSWAYFGTVFQRVFKKHEKALDAVMAGLLVYCAYRVSGVRVF
jgi:threonine/homoserine/homoserine lactone efflux protein